MASLHILLIVGAVILPFVQNAPSTIMKSPTEEDFRTRVTFIDPDADEAVKISLPRSIQKKTAAQNAPKFEMKSVEPSTLSQMDDDRRIWGMAVESKEIEEDESYYNRPLNLKKTVVTNLNPTKKVVVNIAQKVETPVQVPKPSECDFSIMICCGNPAQLKECFKSQGCINATEDMFPRLCSSDSINRVVKDLGNYFKGNLQK